MLDLLVVLDLTSSVYKIGDNLASYSNDLVSELPAFLSQNVTSSFDRYVGVTSASSFVKIGCRLPESQSTEENRQRIIIIIEQPITKISLRLGFRIFT